jgi:hypothetical protein
MVVVGMLEVQFYFPFVMNIIDWPITKNKFNQALNSPKIEKAQFHPSGLIRVDWPMTEHLIA